MTGILDTRSYIIGYVFILDGGAIGWLSMRQPVVGASMMKAGKFKTVASDGMEVLWLRMSVYK